jgi:hypothetical protein
MNNDIATLIPLLEAIIECSPKTEPKVEDGDCIAYSHWTEWHMAEQIRELIKKYKN